MFFRVFLAFTLLAGFTSHAQQTSDSALYTLRGTVVNSVTGAGVPGALVRVEPGGRRPCAPMRRESSSSRSYQPEL